MRNVFVEEREKIVLSELKDFQRATVERCFHLLTNGQRRVLVADEVGLGKTLIARGIIAKLAHYNKKEGDTLFKVLYICSNSAIASQNIRKLKIYDNVTVDGVSDTRLSMQHLKIFEQENDPEVLNGYIQLIPLTPATSFNITSGGGKSSERALMYTILEHLPAFRNHEEQLRSFLMQSATMSFPQQLIVMRERVDNCNDKSNGKYLGNLLDEIGRGLTQELIRDILEGKVESISKLRLLFAQISIRRLEPDLVIMDEFQRFRELITATPDSETGLLTDAFLKKSKAYTLLLSATPYKLYQTLEEAAESGVEEHYQEFLEVTRFIFDDQEKNKQFQEIWRNFSVSLREASSDFGAVIRIKSAAEAELYNGVCRTERLIVDSGGEFLDDSQTRVDLSISERDIQSFIQADTLSQSESIPVEYVKSCPYLLSFMEKYKYKMNIRKLKPNISRKARQVLFVDESRLRNFEPIPANNARLDKLMSVAFDNAAEMLLWVPPTIPYYEPYGVFRGKEDFSKVLVFSAWEMVPRMIACTISYECERRTIGKLYSKEEEKRNKGYLSEAKTRYPYRKLTENRSKPITTASETLARLYNPVEHMGKSISEIKRIIQEQLQELLERLIREYNIPQTGTVDPEWYWIAPLLFDTFIAEGEESIKPDIKIPERKLPADIAEVLVNMTIASPAISALRLLKDKILAEKLAEEVAYLFDKPEAISVVELAYGKSDDAHYKNVLKYCVDGNFAAMLDEYAHILNDNRPDSLCKEICEALQTTTASYSIDTYANFVGDRKTQIRMRSHYAVGFYQTRGDEKTVQRKDTLRIAFNSPFRPFVLATTSIGQEGLDFHHYARKIMHWNLPHNPVDLEQREGRINRYKCHAIRQSLAREYRGRLFDKNVWEEVFQHALQAKGPNEPELIPYWCLPQGGAVKIERIVPMYPYSKDQAIYKRLLRILSLYRVTMGQTRQEELLEHLFNNCEGKDLKELFINLCPFTKTSAADELPTIK